MLLGIYKKKNAWGRNGTKFKYRRPQAFFCKVAYFLSF